MKAEEKNEVLLLPRRRRAAAIEKMTVWCSVIVFVVASAFFMAEELWLRWLRSCAHRFISCMVYF